MIPDGPPTPHRAASTDRRDLCEACGSAGGSTGRAAVLLEIPIPTAVLENLGLPVAPLAGTRLLCAECLGKGLQGQKLDLMALVRQAPISVQQRIHAHLIQAFEI